MPFIYSHVQALEQTAKVGTKQCVALIQHDAPGGGNTGRWSEGEDVLENEDIVPGTAIATFVNGRYPNHQTGNHAAFFVKHAVHGFWVMDQWANDQQKPLVCQRLIRTKGKTRRVNGTWPEGGNNAYAYSSIER